MSLIKDMSSIIVDKIHSTVKIDNPTHVIELPKQVMRVEMSPYEWSHNIMCIAYEDEIAIATIKFQVGNRLYLLCFKEYQIVQRKLTLTSYKQIWNFELVINHINIMLSNYCKTMYTVYFD